MIIVMKAGALKKDKDEVLKRIKETGEIFFAESDRPWVLDGANVHISMVGFDDGTETARRLDGQLVQDIHANLTSASDTTAARPIAANAGRSFMGDTKGGAFDIPETLALEWLYEPNPHGEPNSSVLVPWVNGKDLTGRSRSMWIIDFGIGMSEEGSARFEKPFEYARERVQEGRESEESRSTVGAWWQHERARPEMRAACSTLQRYIATPRVAKYRLFVWLDMPTLADSALISFASDDDAMFGLLHSRPHELWAIAQGTQLREKESGARYTPSTCFETFPLPAMTPAFRRAITNAATDLDRLRNTYLAPPEWTKRGILKFPGTMRGPWSRLVDDADARGLGTVRYERIVPVDDKVRALLAARTLTKLYNQLPTWLTDAHRALDEAVFAAYGWPADLSDEQILRRLLELNRAQAMT